MPATLSKHEIGLGDPVWARMEGFPWWPGHVVTREEVILDEGVTEPNVGEDEVLVEFFNDNKRFAAMPLRFLRPFVQERYKALNRNYSGVYASELKGAVQEATDFCRDHNLKIEGDHAPSSKPGKAKLKPKLKPTRRADDQISEDARRDCEQRKEKKDNKSVSQKAKDRDESRDDERKLKTSRKRHAQDLLDEQDERDRDRSKKKKKRNVRPDSSTPDHVKSEKRLSVPVREEKLDKRRIKRKHSDVIRVGEDMPSAVEDRERKARRRSEDEEGSFRRDRKVDPSASRGQRHRSSAKEENLAASTKKGPKEVDDPKHREEDKRAIFKKERSWETRRDKEEKRPGKEAVDKKEDVKPTTSGTHRRGKRGHDFEVLKKHPKDEKENSPDKKLIANSAPLDDPTEDEGLAYRSLSQEQLVKVLVARDKQLRSYSLQLWQYRMEDGGGGGPKTRADLVSAVHPAWKAVSDFITVSESQAGKEVKSAKWQELEVLAVEHLQKLRMVHFNTALLKEDPRIAGRAIKLASKSLSYSVPVSMAFRELILQWTEMGALNEEAAAEDEGEVKTENGHASPNRRVEEGDQEEKDSGDKASDEEGGGADEKQAEGVDGAVMSSRAKDEDTNPAEKDKSKDEKGSSSGNSADEVKTPERKDGVRRRLSGGGRMGEDDRSLSRGSSRKGTPVMENSPTERTSSHEEVDSAQKRQRREKRVKDFSRARCIAAIENLIKRVAEREEHAATADEKKHHALADEMESQITPQRKDDGPGYYQASKNLVKLLSRLSAANTAQDEEEDSVRKDSKARGVLCKCLDDLKAVPGLVKRLSNMV